MEKVINISRRALLGATVGGAAAKAVLSGLDRLGDAGDSPVTGIAIPGIRLLYETSAVMTSRISRVAATGARWLRFDATWSEIEYARGHYDFSHVDRAVDASIAHGL